MNTKQQVMQAYADCNMPWEVGSEIRNLNFRADKFVSRDKAFEILSVAIPSGYNNFSAELIKKFPSDCQIQIAREASVCLYVKGRGLPKAQDVLADEKDGRGIVRYWWD